nr:M23 family metallopeptidase [Hungatella hathewayi]
MLAIALAAACAFPAYGTSSDINKAKDKASSLEEEKKKVETTLKNLEGLKADMEAYVRELDASLESVSQEVTNLEWQIHDKEMDIERAGQELLGAKLVEQQQYQAMKLRIQYMYEMGETNFIDMLLQSKDMGQFLNRAEYIARITEYDKKKLDEYRAVKKDIAGREAVLEEEHAELMELKDATEIKRASVEELLKAKRSELEAFDVQISSAEGKISKYEQDIKDQEDRIKKIEAEIKRKEEAAKKEAEAIGKKYNTTSIGNIKFIWPCPSSSRITSEFGARESPTEGASTGHKGMDIGAASGSSIRAAAAGEVTISTYSYSAGNYIMINHGGGVSTVYMHCSQLLVSEGETVTQGQEIAKVGSTGVSTGPHLHFGIRVNGDYVNPAGFVSP